MTEPTGQSPQDKAKRMRETMDRWEDSARTVQITKPPSKAVPLNVESPIEEDDDDG